MSVRDCEFGERVYYCTFKKQEGLVTSLGKLQDCKVAVAPGKNRSVRVALEPIEKVEFSGKPKSGALR